MIRSVLFDFGGVITTSPFDAFARYERDEGLPAGLIRTINATDPNTNAWARLERHEIGLGEFCTLFEAEARTAGHDVDARAVVACLAGDVRPRMVEAVRRCAERFKTACLTNNFVTDDRGPDEEVAEVFALFHLVLESSKLGVRKPDPRIYELACEALDVEPDEVVFLDDLGVNLKPARQMGMHTVKVTSPEEAIRTLSSILGIPL